MADKKSYTIYALVDPRTEEIRYVGKTRVGVEKRKNSHVSGAKRGEFSHKCSWIRILLDLNMSPKVISLESDIDADDANYREKHWVSYGRERGWPLTNKTLGGEGGVRVTTDTRKNLSIALKGRVFSDKHRQALRDARANQPPMSRETIDRIADSNRGRPMHENTKKVLLTWWVGKKHSDEHKKRVSIAKTGLVLSEEVKNKIREKALGRVLSEDTKKKIGASQEGKIVSIDTKNKMSEAAKLVWKTRKETEQKKKEV